MADSQIVKITFDFDLGNVPASAKKMKDALSGTITDTKQLDAATKQFSATLDKLATAQTKVASATTAAGNSLKNSNKQWTSLSLVVQDLPYGFRGIQNNLPALFGSIASAAGPAYFAFSALVAITTAYEKEITALFVTITQAEKQQQLYNNVVKESGSAYVDAQTQLISLNEKIKLAKEGYIDKQNVVNDYNDTIGKTIGKQKDLEGVNQALINQGPAYVDYMNKMAMAVAAAKLVAQETENIVRDSAKSADQFITEFDAFFSAKFNIGGLSQSLIASSQAALKVGEKAKQSQLSTAEKAKAAYTKIMQDMYKSAGEAAKKAGVVPGEDKGGVIAARAAQQKAEREHRILVESLKAEEALYKDNIVMKESVAQEILRVELAWDLLEAKRIGASEEEKKLIRDKYANLQIASARDLGNEIAKITKKYSDEDAEESLKIDAMQLQMKIAMQHALTSINKKFASDEAKEADRVFQNKMDAIKQKLAVELKANKKSPVKKVENYQGAIQAYTTLGAEAGNTAKQIEKTDDEINSTKSSMEGLIEATTPLADILNNLATNILVEFGTQIGNALSGAGFSLDGFLGLIADALIQLGTHLVTVSGLFAAFDALFASEGKLAFLSIPIGLAAIAAGTMLKGSLGKKETPKVKGFANGGIISGPTMGLMGEYPGAKSNPEVVAPLDKLKNLIGGSTGVLETRISGNDLLILMNKAQRNNNLSF